VYSDNALQEAVVWARAHQIHVVIDEIYACSVHSPRDGKPWHCALDILEGNLGNDVVSDNTRRHTHTPTHPHTSTAKRGSAIGHLHTNLEMSVQCQYIRE
jgi:hypothetical protein